MLLTQSHTASWWHSQNYEINFIPTMPKNIAYSVSFIILHSTLNLNHTLFLKNC